MVEVTSAQEVSELLLQASKARATAYTRYNEQSSRSHSVFVMHAVGTHEATGEVNHCLGCLCVHVAWSVCMYAYICMYIYVCVCVCVRT